MQVYRWKRIFCGRIPQSGVRGAILRTEKSRRQRSRDLDESGVWFEARLQDQIQQKYI